MNFPHSIQLLSLAANAARSNAACQESFGTTVEAKRQKEIETELRIAGALLAAAAEQGLVEHILKGGKA